MRCVSAGLSQCTHAQSSVRGILCEGLPKAVPACKAKSTLSFPCRDAVKAGKIDGLASDHSPCPPDMKELESGNFMKAWGGIAGQSLLATAIPGTRQRAGRRIDWPTHVPCKHLLWHFIERVLTGCSHLYKSARSRDSGNDRKEACRLAVWAAWHLERHAAARHEAGGRHKAVEHACGQAGGDAGPEGSLSSGHGCGHSGEGPGSAHIRRHRTTYSQSTRLGTPLAAAWISIAWHAMQMYFGMQAWNASARM